jgi:uncharacterized membrane protein YkvA (DUF1232 family)
VDVREIEMTAEQTAVWTHTEADAASAQDDRATNEETVRRGFWKKLRRFSAQLPFAEDLLAAYYCAFDRETPRQVQAALLAALAYFVVPLDVLPDIVPMLGFTDDAAVLAGALRMLATHIRPEHRTAARAALERELAH